MVFYSLTHTNKHFFLNIFLAHLFKCFLQYELQILDQKVLQPFWLSFFAACDVPQFLIIGNCLKQFQRWLNTKTVPMKSLTNCIIQIFMSHGRFWADLCLRWCFQQSGAFSFLWDYTHNRMALMPTKFSFS